MKKSNLEILAAWEKITKEKTVWQHLAIENSAFYFKTDDKKIFLSSFKDKDLPASPYSLTLMGKILTKLSTFANIMSKRPGTEEVTFYSILNTPGNKWFGSYFDRKILDIVSPPITWRRIEIENLIKSIIKKYIFEYNESFAFVDIGSGGGFDSLEIERVILSMNYILGEDILPQKYDILNIDIDSKWLKNNQKLSKCIFGDKSRIKRCNISIFDYLNKKSYIKEFSSQNNLIVSCNGFAEFLSDKDLEKLYMGIRYMADTFSGRIHIILPFANKNKKQEELGDKIGFKFRAKEKEYMINLINDIFSDFKVSFTEEHSQIVLLIEK
ncbi:hypothetical protein ADU90_13725 [Clostridium botulinum]|uniref:Methyltransferase n=1 Tax=Clostridium botulinum C/D str. DC5 TaxID=1443128 RepID=A0A0A0IDX9_CLOBO|nr:hypothetical protein [Clostridium botulinum]KEI04400.1 hypothetical protein Z952_06940 [Clostridium botulinum C/D str. BKT75002]KEI11309.1 hypothetical protein Z954_08420 [Clostridium botulinum C/D str. BKT2873]KGM95279.1 hypothetical protein Z956_05285 [Clostridium botulinum D str. CCUG 7971]KGM99152.1 hypothetical protein Z955_08520 [Clostridium botulinum C/D str. DC5]KOC46584.1 hypothetical protein ADU88_11850 [Clostridium botulinum]